MDEIPHGRLANLPAASIVVGFQARLIFATIGSNIWNNSEPDPAVLINPAGQEISRW
ncbi:MAG TPA: hypothetical protein PKE20_15645 [Promineifilum sp.]|nr:hypothetical protein [Promineifilum sp.]